MLANGDLNNGSAGGKLIQPQKLPQQKKILPTIDNTRNDLLKAIRDGKHSVFFSSSLFLFLFIVKILMRILSIYRFRCQSEKSGKN